MPDWRGGGSQSAMGISASCYIWHLCGVVVLHRSMVNWGRRGRINLPWYVCILLYVKHL